MSTRLSPDRIERGRAMSAPVLLSHRRVSPKEVARLGWTPAPRISGRSRFANFIHRDGWTITHCGHPTALWPYILTDPQGNVLLTGAAVSGRADFGTAWPSVAAAMDYVATRAGSPAFGGIA